MIAFFLCKEGVRGGFSDGDNLYMELHCFESDGIVALEFAADDFCVGFLSDLRNANAHSLPTAEEFEEFRVESACWQARFDNMFAMVDREDFVEETSFDGAASVRFERQVVFLLSTEFQERG